MFPSINNDSVYTIDEKLNAKDIEILFDILQTISGLQREYDE